MVTLFHEFGHLLHHVLAGRHAWVRFSGVATEWDFVEAPSARCSRSGRGTPACCRLRHRRGRGADPGRPGRADARRRGVRQGRPRPHPDVLRLGVLPLPRRAARRPDRPLARALRAVRRVGGAARLALPLRLRPPGRLHLGVLHLHVEPGDREGPVLGLRPRRPVRTRGRAALPRPGAGGRRQQGRRRPGRGLPRPSLRARRPSRPGWRGETRWTPRPAASTPAAATWSST